VATNPTSGVSKALAHELGRHGADVVVHGLVTPCGEAMVDVITEGGNARLVAAAVSSTPLLEGLVRQADPVDLQVNDGRFSRLRLRVYPHVFRASIDTPQPTPAPSLAEAGR
jgi:NAD(P)-dependent dehydrogenase (short-subunit alcohol dehydrogenase family)